MALWGQGGGGEPPFCICACIITFLVFFSSVFHVWHKVVENFKPLASPVVADSQSQECQWDLAPLEMVALSDTWDYRILINATELMYLHLCNLLICIPAIEEFLHLLKLFNRCVAPSACRCRVTAAGWTWWSHCPNNWRQKCSQLCHKWSNMPETFHTGSQYYNLPTPAYVYVRFKIRSICDYSDPSRCE